MAVAPEQQIEMMKHLMPPMMSALAGYAGDADVTADDVVSVCALGIALILDNDTHLTTPRDKRNALDAAKAHIAQWVELLGKARGPDGSSVLDRILSSADSGLSSTH